MSNDAAWHGWDEVVVGVQEQMHDLSIAQQKRSALTAKAFVADETVALTRTMW